MDTSLPGGPLGQQTMPSHSGEQKPSGETRAALTLRTRVLCPIAPLRELPRPVGKDTFALSNIGQMHMLYLVWKKAVWSKPWKRKYRYDSERDNFCYVQDKYRANRENNVVHNCNMTGRKILELQVCQKNKLLNPACILRIGCAL